MKKQEILAVCIRANVRPGNLTTFLNSNKERKKLLPKRAKIREWLVEHEAREIEKAEKEAQKMKAKKFGVSIKQLRDMEEKAHRLLSHFSTGYSMGDHKSVWINGIEFYSVRSTEQYAGKYKGRETYGRIVLDFKKSEFLKLENIHGLWTIRGKAGSAKWLIESKAKQHYKIFYKTGYIVDDSHGGTLEEAQALETQKQVQKRFEGLGDKAFVGIQHIKKTGACEAGIQAYINRHGLDPEFGYNLGYLKSLENSIFLKRIN